LEICDEFEEEEHLEVFGPQIELDLGEGSSIHEAGEPSIEVVGVAPTVEVEVEEESSVEVLEAKASVPKEMRDQAVQTGDEPVLMNVEMETGAEPVLMNAEEIRTGDEPVLDIEEMRTGEEPVPADVEMGTSDIPVREMKVGDSHFEDFPSDDFEKVGEFMPEETPQTPTDLAAENPLEKTPSSAEPRRKRIKTPTGRTDLPWVRKLITLKSQTSPSSQQSSHKQHS